MKGNVAQNNLLCQNCAVFDKLLSFLQLQLVKVCEVSSFFSTESPPLLL